MIMEKPIIKGIIILAIFIGVGCLLIFGLGIFESAKGERSFIMHEARSFQIELRKSAFETSKDDLQNLIGKVSTIPGTARWKISERGGILLETVRLYDDFRDVNDQSRWRYCIDQKGRLILIGEDGRQSLVSSSYFGINE